MMEPDLSPDIQVGQKCHIQLPTSRYGPDAAKAVKEYLNVAGPNANVDDTDDDWADDISDQFEMIVAAGDPLMANLAVNAVVAAATAPATEIADVLGTSQDDDAHVSNDDNNDGIDPRTGHYRVPRVARVRCNLTVLSQRYNLYFAAYQNKIHVYQPQRPPQILPPVSLILRPPTSRLAKMVGGVQDRRFPHQMNYITVGDLGDLEILLLAFDDGDVIAYYTHPIAKAIESRNSRLAPVFRLAPFFHENVGLSAWGLAIHASSRLIAVSSNLHEVTVFAFALRNKQGQADEPFQVPPEPWTLSSRIELERRFRSRTRTWRIVLSTGHDGRRPTTNIPSIAFYDDELGNADKVAAVDIHGNTWLIDIWQLKSSAKATLFRQMSKAPGGGFEHVHDTGWSVLVLPDSSFKPALSNHEALGLPAAHITGVSIPIDAVKKYVSLDTTASLLDPDLARDMAANPVFYLRHQHIGRYHSLWGGNTLGTIVPSTGFMSFHGHGVGGPAGYDNSDNNGAHSPPEGDPSPLPEVKIDTSTFDRTKEHELGFELELTIVPVMGHVEQPTTAKQLRAFTKKSDGRKEMANVVDWLKDRPAIPAAKNVSIMTAFTTGVELLSLDPSSASLACHDVLVQHNHHNKTKNIPWDMDNMYSERISMHHHVPELGLVVLGSLTGRVALLSLTRPPEPHEPQGRTGHEAVRIRRGFRVVAVLPRKDEENRRLRPWCTLHGMAVSPVPEPATKGLKLRASDSAWRPRTWRLILHYADHTILMYDIARRGDDGDLLIF